MAEWRNYKPVRAFLRSGLEPFITFLRELDTNAPWTHARRVAVAFDGTSTTADVAHGLGRSYTGGWLGDVPDVARDRGIVTGSVAAAAGVDVATYVRVVQSGAATAETVYVWVY